MVRLRESMYDEWTDWENTCMNNGQIKIINVW